MEEKFLSPFQRRTLSAAVTIFGVIVILGFIGLMFFALADLVSYFTKVIWPLVIAVILALLLRPVIEYPQKRFKWGAGVSVFLLYVLMVVVIVGTLIFAIPPLFNQLVRLIKFIPTLTEHLFEILERQFPSIMMELKGKVSDFVPFENADELLKKVYGYMPTVLHAGTSVFGFFTWITALAVTPIYLFYILTMKSSFLERLDKELSFMKARWREDIIYLLRKYTEIIESFFRGQLMIGVIMGILYSIGFYGIGLQFALILGVGIGFLNIIPYLGTIIGLGTVIPIAFLQEDGSWMKAVLAVGVFCTVQVIEGYVLTPRIMGEKTGLHPMTIILSLFFWGTALNGILGIILAIPLTASIVATWYLLKKKYLSG